MISIDAFLTARYNEAAAVARDAAAASGYVDRRPIPDWTTDGHSIVAGGVIAAGIQGALDPPVAWHIVQHDPAHVLADLAAKRSVVEDYVVLAASNALERDEVIRAAYGVAVKSLWLVLRRFAAVYAAHPDFVPAWRIDG
jgi:predicted membrane-bound dolichyl-phosphate-mannose-protein mannosyltransferase